MTRLSDSLRALGLSLEIEQPLRHFTSLFEKWNRSINLSAARSAIDLHDHIIDCLHVVPHLRATRQGESSPLPARVLDVGAGGGLPAIIIAICLPRTQVVALEPVHKKHAFLRAASRELSLANLDAIAQRLESHSDTGYDAATSRATFDLREWLLLGLTHVRPEGRVFGFEAVPRLDLPPSTERHPYLLGDRSRSIVTLRRS